jgi:acyl-CoA synthetase (AMP-forming)/AMP-acid ligase II
MNVASAFSRHAAIAPQRTALIDPGTGRSLSFGELDRRSASLAAALAGEGVGHGDRVSVLAKNCIEYFEIYLACAKAGCIAQGMNWRFATPAMVASLQEVQPRLVIYEDRFGEQVDELQRAHDGAIWRSFGPGSDGSYEELVQRGASAPAPSPGGDEDPLMILHTGGTTGDSKGAVHSHATMRIAMANNTIAERIVPSDRYMLIGQAFHSAAVLALNYLCHGCGVVVVNFEPRSSLEAIEECGVTCFLGFPTMVTYMLEEGTSGRFDLSSLRNIQYGGGAFAETTIFGLLDSFPCRLIQCYGTTESIGITFLTQEDHDRARSEPGLLRSCGTPAFLTEVKLAADAEPAEQFGGRDVGEVLVRSGSNMLGYWAGAGEGGLLRCPQWLPTGDLGYFDDRGYLHLAGRSKDVIISGGENIYAAQVENAIHKHPDVIEAAVIGVPDEVWGEAVKAVVVLRAGSGATAADIQEQVSRELASYQKPRLVDFVAELPKTPTGKILKRALQ